jgi:hypothetical protein
LPPLPAFDDAEAARIVELVKRGYAVYLAIDTLGFSLTRHRRSMAEEPTYRQAIQDALEVQKATALTVMYTPVTEGDPRGAAHFLAMRMAIERAREAKRERAEDRRLKRELHRLRMGGDAAEAQRSLTGALERCTPEERRVLRRANDGAELTVEESRMFADLWQRMCLGVRRTDPPGDGD